MATKNTYRFAIAVEILSLWRRRWGDYSLLALIAGVFLSVIEGVPVWAPPAAFAAAVFFALAAVWRMQSILAVRRNGVEIEGLVRDVEREEHYGGSSDSAKVRKRLTFEYTYEGKTYTGRTQWAGSGRFETLGEGNPIPVIVDSKRPEHAAWAKEVPLRMPQLMGF